MVKRGPVDRDDERAAAGRGNARSAGPGEDHTAGVRGPSEQLLHLQRRMGNRAVGHLLQHQRPTVQREAGSPITVQRKLPSHIDVFSVDLMADRHNALVGRINTEVAPRLGRCGELTQALNGFDITAGIDAEVVKAAASKIRSESDRPGTQAIEKSTETYLKAYEAFEVAPTPDVETQAVYEAFDGLEAKLIAAEKVTAEAAQSKDQDAVNAEKKRIDTYVKNLGTGVELTLKTLKALETGQGWADLGISIVKEGSTRLAEWNLSNEPRMKDLEARLEQSKQRLLNIKTMEAAEEVEKAESALAKVAAALDRKMREIGTTIKELERAERDLAIDMRALGLEGAAQAVETRAAARRTATEMLVALQECRLAIEALLPEAIEVHQSFAALAGTRNDRGSRTLLSPEQELELASIVENGKRSRTFLEDNLKQIERNRAVVESGHFDKIYQPVQETLHQTQI